MTSIVAAAVVAPTGPGVYFFLDAHNQLVYVGKAANLRRRLQQHANAARARATPRDVLRAELVDDVRWEECVDEGEAAAREADLIVAFRPLLNASFVTDGRWVYLEITPDPPSDKLRLHLTATASGAPRTTYGCFPHLGTGVSSRRAIACSEGVHRSAPPHLGRLRP